MLCQRSRAKKSGPTRHLYEVALLSALTDVLRRITQLGLRPLDEPTQAGYCGPLSFVVNRDTKRDGML